MADGVLVQIRHLERYAYYAVHQPFQIPGLNSSPIFQVAELLNGKSLLAVIALVLGLCVSH